MNQLQEKQLEILLEIDRACKKHNITYMLDGGTLLGAIRHKGFIPWDDDLDIMMNLKDYKKFLKVAEKELNSKFFLQCCDTDRWYLMYTKIRMNGTTMIEQNYEKINFHQGIWVDIFPIVGLDKDEKKLKNKNKALSFSNLLLQDAFFDVTPNLSVKLKAIKLIPLSLRRTVAKIIRWFIFKNIKNYEYADTYWGFDLTPRFRSKWFEEVTYKQFEGHSFPVPKMYDEFLSCLYGDYMTPPPPDKRNGGHYISVLDFEKSYEEYIK